MCDSRSAKVGRWASVIGVSETKELTRRHRRYISNMYMVHALGCDEDISNMYMVLYDTCAEMR